MRHLFRVVLPVAVLAASLGCGSNETKLPGPMTDEQKRAVQEEDKRVADEEGGKPQKGKKPVRN